MKAWGATDRGRVRARNEDAYFLLHLDERTLVCGVADGLGGLRSGEVAASLAVDVARERIREGWREEVPVSQLLRRAIWEAHDRIRGIGRRSGGGEMGSTLTLALLRPGRADLGHVGDSRAYLWREGFLRQLTRDHSPVGEMLRRGELTEAQAQRHPQRHLLDQAVGAGVLRAVDLVEVSLQRGDVLLLCTDGLTAVVESAEIAAVLAEEERARVPQRLIEVANQRGGPDNVTVVVAEARWEETGDC